ncbi:hypothetical protein ACFYS8_06275 [Kitasatospora sp. NPDC004615]|uniref:hypothetical protein n=1 Tax=unclassified Kitasatospora TaxID=2633591 RepID=UPI0036B16579
MPDVDVIVGQVVPAIGAAVGAYGVEVLRRTQDAAAGATVGLGQRLLARLLHRAPVPAPLEAAVEDLAEDRLNPDALAALRLQVRRLLLADPELAAQVAAMLPPVPAASPVQADGERSVAVGTNHGGRITTGDNSPISGPE